MKCELFQHPGNQQGNCTLISSDGEDTLIATENNLIYNMGEFEGTNPPGTSFYDRTSNVKWQCWHQSKQ